MAIQVEAIRLPSPLQGGFIKVSSFPVPAAELMELRNFLDAFGKALEAQHRLERTVCFQLWSLSPRTGSSLVSSRAKTWLPSYGLGVWPNRKPPQGWTDASLQDAAGAALLGEEPERPSHRLLSLTCEPAQQAEAALAMRGFGAQFELFTNGSSQQVKDACAGLFLSRIVEERFRNEAFYLPLLDLASLAAAKSREELEEWLCGAVVYLRESAEDKSVLIVSRLPLEAVFDVAAKFAAAQSARVKMDAG